MKKDREAKKLAKAEKKEAKKLAKKAKRENIAFKKTKHFLWGSLWALLLAYVICCVCFKIELNTMTSILWCSMLVVIAIPLVLNVVGRLLKCLWKLKWPIIVSVIVLIAIPVAISVALEGGNVVDLGEILSPIVDDVLALVK